MESWRVDDGLQDIKVVWKTENRIATQRDDASD